MELFDVLLIEDNLSDAFMIKFYLENSKYAKYEVHHEEELEGGIKAARRRKYDIIILDLNLNNSENLSTLESFQKEAPDNFIIVSTGFYDEELGIEALKMGAQDYIVKGQQDTNLFNIQLRYAMERYKAYQNLNNLAQNLEQNTERFHVLQKMSNSGYFEFSFEDGNIKLSTVLAHHIFDLDHKEMPFEKFFELFKDSPELEKAMRADIEDKSVIITYKGKKLEFVFRKDIKFYHRHPVLVKVLN